MRSEPRLYYYIRSYKEKGHTPERITELLISQGYTDRDVKEALHEFANAKDLVAEDKLVEYFERHVNKGLSLPDLVEHAIKSNVDRHLIQRAVLRIQTTVKEDNKTIKKEVEEVAEEEIEIPIKPFNWKDTLLILVLIITTGLSFIKPLFPIAAVIIITLYIMRWIGTSGRSLGIAALGCAIVLFVTASIIYAPVTGIWLFLVLAAAAILFFLH